jgi:hypothetical protein
MGRSIMTVSFDAARRRLARAHEGSGDLCDPFISVLPISGASLSILGTPRATNSTICASDSVAARIDEIQFDLGEGPCWDALSSHSPVLRPDITVATDEWPAFGEAMNADPGTAAVSSIFAFHLSVGSLDIGSVDLYSTEPATLDPSLVEGTVGLANVAAWQVLRKIVSEDNDEPATYSRREVHQATGMLIVQLDVSVEEAGLLLRAHAFASGKSVRELASDVVARRVDFSIDGRETRPEVGS